MHASESSPVFFRSMVHLFGAILNDVTISLRKAFCLVLRCLSDVLEGSSFIYVIINCHMAITCITGSIKVNKQDDYTGIFEFG